MAGYGYGYFQGGVPIGSNVNQNEPEVDTYITGLTTQLSSAQIANLNTLVSSLKTALNISNLSDSFDVLRILAGETEESSLKNLAKNSHHATAVNSPTFNQFEGFTGNRTSAYIEENYNPSTDKSAISLNDASLFVYSRTQKNANYIDYGCRISTINDQFRVNLRYADQMFFSINQDPSTIISNLNSLGCFIITRRASNDVEVYANGSSFHKSTQVSDTTPNLEMYTLAVNENGVPNYFSGRQIAIVGVAKGMTTAQAQAVTNAFEAYMDANGKGVIA